MGKGKEGRWKGELCGRHALHGSIRPLYIYWATNEIDALRPARAVCHASRHRDVPQLPLSLFSLSAFSVPLSGLLSIPSLSPSLPALSLCLLHLML